MVRWIVIGGAGWLALTFLFWAFMRGASQLNEQWDKGQEVIGEKGRCVMGEEKTIRCTKCYEEFCDEEGKNVSCCPKCGSKGVPMSISQDVEIKINWHELRILANWAEYWAEEKCELDSKDTLQAILDRLEKYRPEGGAALTLAREVKDLQEVYPETTLVRGDKILVPPRRIGKA
jgi:hypothetical protein